MTLILSAMLAGTSVLGNLSASVSAAETTMEQNLENGMIVNMDMDGDYEDSVSGNAPVFAGEGHVTYEQGVKGEAMRFSEGATTATRLEFSDREDLQFEEDDAFTIGVWVKVRGIDGDPIDPTLLGTKDWDLGHNNGFTLAIRDNYFNFNTKSVSLHTRYDNKFATTFEDQWHFVVMTQDEHGSSAIYVDGQKGTNQEVTDVGNNDVASGAFTIGATFKGSYGCKDQVAFDELKIWDRVLDQEEIDYLYANTADLQISGPDVIDLSSGQESEAVYRLDSAGSIEGNIEWSCDREDVRIVSVSDTVINVLVSPQCETGFFTLRAKRNEETYEKTVEITRDIQPVRASIKGDDVLSVKAGESSLHEYSLALYNQHNVPVANDAVNWKITSSSEGISLLKQGQHTELRVSSDAELPAEVTLEAACGEWKDSMHIHVIEEGSLPAQIMDKAEYYLPFEEDLQDVNGHALSVQGDDISLTEDGGLGNGAVFTKGSYIDFGKTDLSNASIAFSIRSDHFTGVKDPCILGNKNWDPWEGSGFTFAYSMNSKDTYKNRLAYRSASGKDLFVSHTDGRWNDIVLSFETDHDAYRIYVDGELQDSVTTDGFVEDWQNGCFDGSTLKLGNDGTGHYPANSSEDSSYVFTLGYFLISNEVLSDEDVSLLHRMRKEERKVGVELVGSDSIAASSVYTADVHIDQQQAEQVKGIVFDVQYDPEVMTFADHQTYMSGIKVETDVFRDRIRISMHGEDGLPTGNIINYINTRIAKLHFQVKDVQEAKESSISVKNIRLYADEGLNERLYDEEAAGSTIQFAVCPNKIFDLNEDGVIGAGDVSLAPQEIKEKVAEQAAIYPYKRVVSVTMDGGGIAWSEDDAWYFQDQLGDAKGLDNVRTNTYAMELHNQEFATSYSAITVNPPISGHNYIAMLTGQNWPELPKEYQYVNDTATKYYWADFGKEEPLYPTVFKAIKDQDPRRTLAMFAEWKAIEEGLIEPDAGAVSLSGDGRIVFDQASAYINENPDLFKKTAYMFLQSDVMDLHGHSYGYFVDSYYEKLKSYDAWWKELIDALKENGFYEDTLIISNADHGGSVYQDEDGSAYGNHVVYEWPQDRTIYFSVGGQTVNKGAKLEGGRTTDLAGIVLEALRMEKPASMSNTGVFDERMFLPQEELKQNGRDVEEVQFIRNTQNAGHARITLENVKNEITTIDTVIYTGDNVLKEVRSEGDILRQKHEDDRLYLTIAFDPKTKPEADLYFEQDADDSLKIEEVMLGTAEGKEIYSDLSNMAKDLGDDAQQDKEELNQAIEQAEALHEEDYTAASWAVLQEALNAAKAIAADEEADQETIDAAAAKLNAAIEALEKVSESASDAAVQALRNMVDKAIALGAEDAALNEAITNAQAVLAKEAPSATEVVTALLDLSEAMQALNTDESTDALRADVRATIDFINENILNDVEGLRPGKVQALKDAVAAAQNVVDNPEATADELKAANKAMTKAAQELWEIVTKAELEALIEAANGYLDGDYTAESLAALQAAIDAAQAVAINDDATTAEVTEAITNLSDAIANLESIQLDKNALEHEIELVSEMVANIDDYIASSVEGLADKLADAQNVLNNATSQAEIDEATKSLREARLNARTKADVSALEALTAYVNSLDLRAYTTESADSVLVLADRALAKMNDPEITQEEVDALAEELQSVIDALQPVSEENVTTPDNSTTGSTTTDTTNTAAADMSGMMIALMAAAGAAAVAVYRRKRS